MIFKKIFIEKNLVKKLVLSLMLPFFVFINNAKGSNTINSDDFKVTASPNVEQIYSLQEKLENIRFYNIFTSTQNILDEIENKKGTLTQSEIDQLNKLKSNRKVEKLSKFLIEAENIKFSDFFISEKTILTEIDEKLNQLNNYELDYLSYIKSTTLQEEKKMTLVYLVSLFTSSINRLINPI